MAVACECAVLQPGGWLYPAFGIDGTDDLTTLDVPYPELSRGQLLLKTFFGWLYCLLPHVFVLYFRGLGAFFVLFLAWWTVLFTAKMPVWMHEFLTGTLRWSFRVNLYMGNMSDTYPPFSGKP